MSAGKPVVGSRIGGIQDQIVDGVTGFLVPPGDVEALRQAMTKLILDPVLRVKMGEAARLRAAEFQASTVVQKIEAVYQTL
jgi:glycosyltransferase involved in cell wall biosynthesis